MKLSEVKLPEVKFPEVNFPEIMDELGFQKFTKLLEAILPHGERDQRRMIINYMNIYSKVTSSFELLTKHSCQRSFEHLMIAKKVIKKIKFEEEQPYLKRILDLLNMLIRHKSKIIHQLKKDDASNPYHIKSYLLLAQNICVIRILKISRY
jgi:hypothetical protein